MEVFCRLILPFKPDKVILHLIFRIYTEQYDFLSHLSINVTDMHFFTTTKYAKHAVFRLWFPFNSYCYHTRGRFGLDHYIHSHNVTALHFALAFYLQFTYSLYCFAFSLTTLLNFKLISNDSN